MNMLKNWRVYSEECSWKLKSFFTFCLIVVVIICGNFLVLTIYNHINNIGNFGFNAGNSSLDEVTIECKEKKPESAIIDIDVRTILIVILVLMLLVCTTGNIFTLVALTYVRRHHGDEFTSLKGSCVLLLFQLSICDLGYGTLGYTHFIHGLTLDNADNDNVLDNDTNPFERETGKILCYILALLRNVFAQVDFSTMGAIAFYACRHKICSKCRSSGQYSSHEEHDFLFTRAGVLMTMCLVWIMGVGAVLPDATGVTGDMKWSQSFYGCDIVYKPCSGGYGLMTNVLINTLIISISYSLFCWRIREEKREAEQDDLDKNVTNCNHDARMILTLGIVYIVCVCPASFLCWGHFDTSQWFQEDRHRQIFECCLNLVYWSMYSVNFILYLCSYNRIRDAYRKYLMDKMPWIWERKASVFSNKSVENDTLNMREYDL